MFECFKVNKFMLMFMKLVLRMLDEVGKVGFIQAGYIQQVLAVLMEKLKDLQKG